LSYKKFGKIYIFSSSPWFETPPSRTRPLLFQAKRLCQPMGYLNRAACRADPAGALFAQLSKQCPAKNPPAREPGDFF